MSFRTAVRPRRCLLAFAGVLAAASMAGPMAGPASAKGGGDGTGDGTSGVVTFISPSLITTTPCQVKTFDTDSKVGVGDTGLSSISADYQVKPCDSKSTVTLDLLIFQKSDPSVVMLDTPNAPLSGDVTVVGVKLGVFYTVQLTIHDGRTGAVIATTSKSALAPFPTGA